MSKWTTLARKLLPILWITLVYLTVTLAEGKDPSPPSWTMAWLLFESRHVAAHTLAFSAEVWLVARAVGMRPDAARRDVAIALGLGVALGIGLEVLQAALRPTYVILDGLWDVLVDGIGAAVGWQIYRAGWRPDPRARP